MLKLGTSIYIKEGLLGSDFIKEFFASCKGKIVLIADGIVSELYAAEFSQRIGAELLTIPSGEKAKSQETVDYLMSALFKMGADRETMLVAIGGGVTTDLVGFVASIYLRGICLIFIPTTLLGMVDASIGGKTAINTPFGKNLIGTIYHPKAIFIDFHVLNTLPEKEWFNGRSEILKMGLILHTDSFLNNDKDLTVIPKAIQGKLSIVEQDPTEQNFRRILNFGHTIGHALETLADYEMPHGEAVALGCSIEAHLSMQLGYLSPIEFDQIQTVYGSFSLRLPSSYTRSKLLQAMLQDKKRASGKIRFVLIDRIGHAVLFEGAYCRAVSYDELAATLDWMEGVYE